MQASRLLAGQMNAVNRHVHDIYDRIEPDAWLRRGAPETNLPAFVFCHAVRGLDSVVQAAVRAVPEVIEAEPWVSKRWARLGIGVGSTLAEADELAALVVPSEVVEYADAVRSEVNGWIRTVTDDELEAENRVIEHISARPAYNYPASLKAAEWMPGMPVWVILSLSGFAHTWSHLEEVELLAGIGRAEAVPGPG